MESLIKLKSRSSIEWVKTALSDIPHFLQDHAACERKASATGVNFVVQYPDRARLIDPMLRLAREELLHFQQVCRLLTDRGLQQIPDEKDPYINKLLALIRTSSEDRLLDRLLVFGIVEARGTERFALLAQNLEDPELKEFYEKLAEAEERHHELFSELALEFFSEEKVRARLDELLEAEARILEELPIRAAVH